MVDEAKVVFRRLSPGYIILSSDPTVADDETRGFYKGFIWLNESSSPRRVYVCVDESEGAADWDQLNAPSGTGVTRSEELTYTDTTNKVLGPLFQAPVPFGALSLFPIEGSAQQYLTDYRVREVAGGSAPGHYICIAPGSTAPGGGAFVGGANPSAGIDAILSSGDVVRVIYPS